MAQSSTSPANSTSEANTESTPECGGEGRAQYRDMFKDMPLGEKYEGKYKFMNVDQADNEISLLSGKVEGLVAVIEKYDSILEVTVTKYRDAMCKCKGLGEEFERLQEEVKVQSHLIETAKNESEKLEEKMAGYVERKGKFEV